MIGIPSYSWTVKIPTMRSLLTDLGALTARGDGYLLHDEAGNTEISMAREAIVRRFLDSDCTDLVFVDDDVCWEAGALLSLLDRPVDLVAGIYPKRTEPLSWPVGWLEGSDLQAVDGLLEVASVPTGFLRLTRACLERMQAAFGAAMFDNIRHETGRYSEDISFCQRWRSIGGKVWIDPEIHMAHVGYHGFTGRLGDWLRER
jgi:hypothetical protein